MCPAGVWGETPPRGVKSRLSKAIEKNIKNYSSNIKYLSPMSIHFSTFAIEKEMIERLKQRHFRKVGREHKNPKYKQKLRPTRTREII